MATIIGTNDPDYLLGTSGDDLLEGLGGNDTLDGGTGNDTYIYNFGDGTDTITDADGLGRIVYRDALGVEYVLGGGVRSPTGSTYYGGQGRFQYLLDEATSTLTVTLDGQVALTIQNYDSVADSLGLALDVNQAPVIQVSSTLDPIRLASVAADGTQANDSSYLPSTSAISADGRYVAFDNFSTNLVAGDTNGTSDVFVKNLQTGVVTRASTAADGTEANGYSQNVSISADGRYVVFESEATNLVVGDTNGINDIFVKNLQTGVVTRASTAADGTEANGFNGGYSISISADGRYVAFESEATNLVAGDTNGMVDIFVKDSQTGAIVRVNTAADGTVANGLSLGPLISADGRYVSFTSLASNLVAGDTNNAADVFVKDLQTGVVTRVSTSADGTQASGYSSGSAASAISADGRYVVFNSDATNLVPGNTNDSSDIFVKDIQTGAIARVNTAADGTQVNGYVSVASISADGRYVTFASYASDLVVGDTNGVTDIFVAPNSLSPPQIITNSNVAVTIDSISVTDFDAGATQLAMTLSVINGSLALQSTTGITFTDADGSDGTLAFSGLFSDLNAALAVGILYTPIIGYSGSDELDISVNDQVYGASLTDTAALAITILPITITGTSGNDTLVGTTASDAIISDAGNDILTGGAGNDTLTGGAGNDTYIFNLGDGVDTINDLSLTGEGNAL